MGIADGVTHVEAVSGVMIQQPQPAWSNDLRRRAGPLTWAADPPWLGAIAGYRDPGSGPALAGAGPRCPAEPGRVVGCEPREHGVAGDVTPQQAGVDLVERVVGGVVPVEVLRGVGVEVADRHPDRRELAHVRIARGVVPAVLHPQRR